MKKIILAFSLMPFAAQLAAQEAPSAKEITKQVIQTVTSYANAISCGGTSVEPKQIAALVPYTSIENRIEAKYAALWTGDIGCGGGSGTEMTNIAIVTIGAGDSYVVDPLQSSPIINFSSPVRYVERVVGNTPDTLILEGSEYDEDDPNCCPSIRVRFTLRVDQNGNWKLTEKKKLPSKK